jgi:hypothetical protein
VQGKYRGQSDDLFLKGLCIKGKVFVKWWFERTGADKVH